MIWAELWVFLPGEDVDANFQQLVQAGAVTITTDGFHAKGTAQALAQIPIEESDAAAIASWRFWGCSSTALHGVWDCKYKRTRLFAILKPIKWFFEPVVSRNWSVRTILFVDARIVLGNLPSRTFIPGRFSEMLHHSAFVVLRSLPGQRIISLRRSSNKYLICGFSHLGGIYKLFSSCSGLPSLFS
jgi:hypothetical protein